MEFDERKALANYRLEQSKENLEEAYILLENNKYKGASNRAYYSMFHGVQALANLEGKDFSKHSGLISYFNYNYIKTGVFSKEVGESVNSAQRYREKSDYDAFYVISREIVEKQVRSAKMVLEQIESYLVKEINRMEKQG